jgi:hypothetical protein
MSLTGTARNNGSQNIHFMRRRIQFSDVNINAGYKIGRLPARAFVMQISINISTVFNSTTSDTVQIGTTASGVDILAATNVHTGATLGFANVTAAAGLGMAVTGSGEVDVFTRLNPGTPNTATTGDVTVVIEFAPDNDG